MEGQPAVDQKAGFTDVAEGSYYAAAVDWAAKNGIVNGVSETSFDPDAAITREQMAAILYRYAAYWELDVSMQWAVANGVINGTSATTLEPAGTATRAQAATVLVRFQNSMKS